jgi:hypothetical protein
MKKSSQCKHVWKTLETFNYGGRDAALIRKCEKCGRKEHRHYYGGDMWRWIGENEDPYKD